MGFYDSFANDKIAIKAGYFPTYIEFIGVLTGGSPLLTTGLSSLVPIQVGLSADPATTPMFSLTLGGKTGFYTKFGVQRSTGPLGQIYEVQHDGIGLDFGSRRASALYITEIGDHRDTAAGTPQMWLPGGIIYNTSDYTSYQDGSLHYNWSAFALADYQIVQSDPKMPYRGIYAGASVFVAPARVNVYTQYYEGRVYAVGLIGSRPSDSITFNVNYSEFSPDARMRFALQNVSTPRGQLQVSTSYSLHVMRGFYMSPSLAYVHHPAFGEGYHDALNLGLSLFTQL